MKPIIILGTGRCGSSIFQQMLSRHPNLAWLSSCLNLWPQKLIYNRILMRSLELPFLESIFRKRFQASECNLFWEFYIKGFRQPFRDLTRADVTIKKKHDIIAAMSGLTTEKRNRLLLKITGWPRLGFLSEVFEDAKFIHIIRDGRAVANSIINVHWWWGWKGPQNWRLGTLPEKFYKEWQNYDFSFIVLAAIYWKTLMDAVEEGKKQLNIDNLLEIKYEDLCSQPIDIFRQVTSFCDLEWSDYFIKRLGTYKLQNKNDNYKADLTNHQQCMLNEVLGQYLKRYGYL